MSGPWPPDPAAQAPTCYRHPDRATYVRCTRCQRPICPECMHSAAVGHQCGDCVRAGAAATTTARTPFGGRQRLGSAPVVTYALIAVNVAVFVLQLASRNLESQFALWPPAVADGQYYRLVTSAFLHYGAMHLVFNMWALYVVGPPLESWLGRLRFGALYALSALGGSVLVYLLSPLNSATAGASGAVFGLFGATYVVAKRLHLDVRWVTGLIVLNVVFTLVFPMISSQSISWQGHLGGLLTGGLIAWAYAYAPRERQTLIHASVTAAMLVLFAALIWWRTGELLDMFGGRLHLS